MRDLKEARELFLNGREKIHMHSNEKLQNGGRKAPIITKNDFEYILEGYKSKLSKEGYDVGVEEGDYSWILEEGFETFSKLNKDLQKIKFDLENHEVSEIKITLTQIPYLECEAGGDWELPVKFFIYHDGKDLRGYIPRKGNVFNGFTKTAIGNGDEWTKDSDNCYILKAVDIDLYNSMNSDVINHAMEVFDKSRIEIQNDWCLEDFESRLEVGYACESRLQKLIEKISYRCWKVYGFKLVETDDVCEDFEREFFIKDSKDYYEDRHAMLFSYGKHDECEDYTACIMIDPQEEQIMLFEDDRVEKVIHYMEKHEEDIVEELNKLYKEMKA